MERERDEAYRVYVSDSLALYSKALTRGEVNIPRYIDICKQPEQPEEEQTPEQIISRFDKLRR